jgi:hypothetical protein
VTGKQVKKRITEEKEDRMGDKVGRDKAGGDIVHGDKVGRDKITRVSGAHDAQALARDLNTLLKALKDEATEPEHYDALKAVAIAEKEAKDGDQPSALRQLSKEAGKWALGVASTIAVPVAIEALKKAIGL